MEEDGARDIVGDVADHPQPTATQASGKRREIDPQEVTLDHFNPGAIKGAYTLGGTGVELHRRQAASTLEEQSGERPFAGADLHHRLPGRGGELPDDLRRDVPVDQKVLTERFLGRYMIHDKGNLKIA